MVGVSGSTSKGPNGSHCCTNNGPERRHSDSSVSSPCCPTITNSGRAIRGSRSERGRFSTLAKPSGGLATVSQPLAPQIGLKGRAGRGEGPLVVGTKGLGVSGASETIASQHVVAFEPAMETTALPNGARCVAQEARTTGGGAMRGPRQGTRRERDGLEACFRRQARPDRRTGRRSTRPSPSGRRPCDGGFAGGSVTYCRSLPPNGADSTPFSCTKDRGPVEGRVGRLDPRQSGPRSVHGRAATGTLPSSCLRPCLRFRKGPPVCGTCTPACDFSRAVSSGRRAIFWDAKGH